MRNKMRKSSARAVAANQDLLSEILRRLPMKSLFRFKSVSKNWLFLISSPFFAKKHTLQNSKPSSTGLFLYMSPYIIYLTLGIHPQPRPSFGPVSVFNFLNVTPYATHLTVLNSCNGLLLCLLIAPPWNGTEIIYFVSNPTTKQNFPLPQLEMTMIQPIVSMDIAFDPKESAHYKVICVTQADALDASNYIFKIFSSETGSWKTCPGTFRYIPNGMKFRGGVYWKGAVHYLNAWGGDHSVHFKIKDETTKLIRVPPVQSEVQANKRDWFMGQSGGHLHLIDIQTNVTRESCIDIYELQHNFTGWCLVHRVDLSDIGAVFPEMIQYIGVAPPSNHCTRSRKRNRNRIHCLRNLVARYYTYTMVGAIQNDDEDVFEVLLSIPEKIVCFDPRHGTGRVLVYFADDQDRVGYEWFNVIQHCETLAPV